MRASKPRAKRLPYKGDQIAKLEKKLDRLKRTSRAFRTKDEYLLWKAQFL